MRTTKDQIKLVPMTRELWHNFYKNYKNDPDIFAENFHEFSYDEDRVNDEFSKQMKDSTRVIFAICLDNSSFPIGALKLKYIDKQKKECSMGISLVNDTVKNKGYGTEAEKLALQYAFEELGMNVVKADAILKNKRSQHVMEKVGFQYVGEDEMFRYYRYHIDKFKEVNQ